MSKNNTGYGMLDDHDEGPCRLQGGCPQHQNAPRETRMHCLRPQHVGVFDEHVLASDYDALSSTVAELRELGEYTDHHAECFKWRKLPCSCGLDALLARLDAKEQPRRARNVKHLTML